MRILIATPLYPPEVAEPAPYAKELARRLVKDHEVTVVAYAHLPEAVPSVRVVVTEKRQALPSRLKAFTRALMREAKQADVVYAMNGPSVELPALFMSLATRTPLVFGMTDRPAHEYAKKHFFRYVLERIAFAHARAIIEQLPPPRPEILPLEPRPDAALADYEAKWAEHLRSLESTFTHAR